MSLLVQEPNLNHSDARKKKGVSETPQERCTIRERVTTVSAHSQTFVIAPGGRKQQTQRNAHKVLKESQSYMGSLIERVSSHYSLCVFVSVGGKKKIIKFSVRFQQVFYLRGT